MRVEQVEVGDVQPFGVGNPVRDGDDDVADRIGRGLARSAARAACARRAPPDAAHSALVLAKRVGEKPRLHAHPRRRAIEIVVAERLVEQLLEPLDLLRLPAELIVEPQHLGDEARTEPERRAPDGAPLPRAPRPAPSTSRSSAVSRRGGLARRACSARTARRASRRRARSGACSS